MVWGIFLLLFFSQKKPEARTNHKNFQTEFNFCVELSPAMLGSDVLHSFPFKPFLSVILTEWEAGDTNKETSSRKIEVAPLQVLSHKTPPAATGV